MKTIGAKIKTGFFILFLVFVMFSLFSWKNMGSLKNRITDLSILKVPKMTLAVNVENRISEIELLMARYVLSENPEDLATAKKTGQKIMSLLKKEKDKCGDSAHNLIYENMAKYISVMDDLEKQVVALNINEEKAQQAAKNYSVQTTDMMSSLNGDISDLIFDEEYDEVEELTGNLTTLRVGGRIMMLPTAPLVQGEALAQGTLMRVGMPD